MFDELNIREQISELVIRRPDSGKACLSPDELFKAVGLDTEPQQRIAKLTRGKYGLNKWGCGAVLLNKEEVETSSKRLKILQNTVWDIYYLLLAVHRIEQDYNSN